jgi:hypothetical protein
LQQLLAAERKMGVPNLEAARNPATPQSDFKTDFEIWVPIRPSQSARRTFRLPPSATLAKVEAEIRHTHNLGELDFSLDGNWDQLLSKDTTIGSINLGLHNLFTRERPKEAVPMPTPGRGPGAGYAQHLCQPADPFGAPAAYRAGAVGMPPFPPKSPCGPPSCTVGAQGPVHAVLFGESGRVPAYGVGGGPGHVPATGAGRAYFFVVTANEHHFQLQFEDDRTIKDARTKVAHHCKRNQPDDVTLLFNGKVLKDNFKLINLRVGTKDIVVHMKVVLFPYMIVTAAGMRQP